MRPATEPDWATVVLQQAADELRHIGGLLRLARRHKRRDRAMLKALERRRSELSRRIQFVCHGVVYSDRRANRQKTLH